MPKEIQASILSQKTLQGLFDKIVQNLFFQVEDKQLLLEERHPIRRMQLLVEVLEKEANILALEQDIYSQVKEQMDKNQRTTSCRSSSG